MNIIALLILTCVCLTDLLSAARTIFDYRWALSIKASIIFTQLMNATAVIIVIRMIIK